MMGSFGPVTALSNLSNNLNQTLASGERVLSLLEEEPQIEEVGEKEQTIFADAKAEHVDFAYEDDDREGKPYPCESQFADPLNVPYVHPVYNVIKRVDNLRQDGRRSQLEQQFSNWLGPEPVS